MPPSPLASPALFFRGVHSDAIRPDVSTFNAIITELLAHDGGFEIAWQVSDDNMFDIASVDAVWEC